ncbi:hypothetical protein D5S18_15415 [Nocardia panacis]|uniref:Uncharacterized protein n=1 Tax=Nocardia panacis TaxID=2340916 RepID=A0A3A4KFV6_9NOCA|nr:hypothetical protein [Nocardia panacis]RJO74828.1 hypothetical protein D5S18_15415 [Nocardia panacis]
MSDTGPIVHDVDICPTAHDVDSNPTAHDVDIHYRPNDGTQPTAADAAHARRPLLATTGGRMSR